MVSQVGLEKECQIDGINVATSCISHSSKFNYNLGGVPERPKGTDCKSVGEAFGGSNPPPTTSLKVSRM